MPPQPISLGTRSNPGRYGQDGAARLINCYAEDAGEEGKIRYPIYACDGYSQFGTTAGTDGIRAMLALSDTAAYFVAGLGAYKVTSAGAVSTLGGVEGEGLCFMARNRADPAQIVIVTDGLVYAIESDTLTQISDVDLPAPNSVTATDGYFVFTIEDGRFFITAIDDTTVDELDFASAEANPDGLMVGATRGRELVLFGPQSIEFWTNTGAEGFPFERVQTTNIGCYYAGSVCEATYIQGQQSMDTIIWAATDAQGAYAGVMVLSGYSGSKISTHAVDRSIRDETDKETIRSFTWSAGGHTYYAIVGSTFSWVYDTATAMWHERQSYGLDRWRVAACMTFAGMNILGDYESGNLYEIDHEVHTEADEPLVMTVIPPAVHTWPSPMRISALYVDTIPGVGLNSTTESIANPMIMLDQSNDNGKTWELAQRTKSLGRIGKYKTRVKFTRLGQSKEDGRVFKLSCSAAVARAITGLAVDARPVKG